MAINDGFYLHLITCQLGKNVVMAAWLTRKEKKNNRNRFIQRNHVNSWTGRNHVYSWTEARRNDHLTVGKKPVISSPRWNRKCSWDPSSCSSTLAGRPVRSPACLGLHGRVRLSAGAARPCHLARSLARPAPCSPIDAAALVVLCARPPVTHAPACASVLRGPRSRAVTSDMLACWPPHAVARVRSAALRSPCARPHLTLLALQALALVCYFFIWFGWWRTKIN
jgi:hypothetical protein